VVLITEMLEICIQTSYDQNVQLILRSYPPVVYGTPLRTIVKYNLSVMFCAPLFFFFVLFILAIVLSALSPFTASDYPFGILKLFL
jgi:hypothetical protein